MELKVFKKKTPPLSILVILLSLNVQHIHRRDSLAVNSHTSLSHNQGVIQLTLSPGKVFLVIVLDLDSGIGPESESGISSLSHQTRKRSLPRQSKIGNIRYDTPSRVFVWVGNVVSDLLQGIPPYRQRSPTVGNDDYPSKSMGYC